MALWAFSYIILGIIKHLGPVVPMVDDLMGKRAAPRVVSAISIVDFLHHSLCLLQIEASQIRVRVEAGVEFFV